MSVPRKFTSTEIAKARDFIIQILGTCRISTKGLIRGTPYVTYQAIVRHLGYEIEDEHDGDNAGFIAGGVTEMEYPLTGIMLGAVVVRASDFQPGVGFFKFAQEFFELPSGEIDPTGLDELRVWNEHVRKAVVQYGAK